jgi:hypothetical protein
MISTNWLLNPIMKVQGSNLKVDVVCLRFLRGSPKSLFQNTVVVPLNEPRQVIPFHFVSTMT